MEDDRLARGCRALAEAVVARRHELALSSQEALATRARLSARVLADIERGKPRTYRRATLLSLAKALEWPVERVDDLLKGAPDRPSLVAALSSPVPPAERRPPKLTDRHLFGPGQRDGFRHETKLRAGRVLARLPGVLDGLDEEDMEYAADALEAVEWVLRRRATARYETVDDHGRAMTDEEVAAQEARFGGVESERQRQ